MAPIAGSHAWAVGEGTGPGRTPAAGLLIVAASVIGALVSFKHYERYQLHLSRQRGFRRSLEKEVTNDLTQIANLWDEHHDQQYHVIPGLRLHLLWLAIYGPTFLIGTSFLVYGISTGKWG